MDQVEGLGQANIRNWVVKFTGPALTYSVTTGLTAKSQYRFRVRAVSEYLKLSLYSDVSTFYAAALPAQIQFPETVFTDIRITSLTFMWVQPTITTNMLPIISYRIYWDSAYLLSGNFALLSEIESFDQFFFTAESLQPGLLYTFQVAAVNAIGESILSSPISHIAQSSPGQTAAPMRTSSAKTDATAASVSLQWTAPVNTGGVSLTGFKLYSIDQQENIVLQFNGVNQPATLSYTITGLSLD